MLALLAMYWLPVAAEDHSCHNPMQGRTSLASEATANLKIDRAEWPAFAGIMSSFARARGWSYRADIRPDQNYPWLYISICSQAGTQFQAQYAPGLPNLIITVQQPQGGLSWQGPFVDLYKALKARWPGKISIEDNRR